MARKPKLRRTPIRTPQQARSRRTREEILKAAVACFETKGYDETTTAAIARKARIAVGTLYGYFPDKRAILLELLDGTTEEITDYVVQSLDPSRWQAGDLRESVRTLIDTLFHTRRIQPGIQRILWERYFKDSEFRKAVEAIEERIKGAMIQLFEALAAQGKLRVQDLSTAAFVIHAAVEWTTSRVVLSGLEEQINPTVEAVTDMVCRFLFRDDRETTAGRVGVPLDEPADGSVAAEATNTSAIPGGVTSSQDESVS
ncbi:MAG: TetR/AcrR family transcriptional regulator [Candidatus Binatia bacterium]|nr:TetR/AcrR family transcriptional regulator [Candidatus Binatia bacterium]